MKLLLSLLAMSLNLSAMTTCEENDEYHINIQGLKKEDILQAFFTFVESKAGAAVPSTLNELDFGPIRHNNWKLEFLKAYYLPLDLSEDVMDVTEFNNHYIHYGPQIAQQVITSLKEDTCLKH